MLLASPPYCPCLIVHRGIPSRGGQSATNNDVRISLDTELWLSDEAERAASFAATIRRSVNLRELGANEAHLFPHAVLEIKLAGPEPPWVAELKAKWAVSLVQVPNARSLRPPQKQRNQIDRPAPPRPRFRRAKFSRTLSCILVGQEHEEQVFSRAARSAISFVSLDFLNKNKKLTYFHEHCPLSPDVPAPPRPAPPRNIAPLFVHRCTSSPSSSRPSRSFTCRTSAACRTGSSRTAQWTRSWWTRI